MFGTPRNPRLAGAVLFLGSAQFVLAMVVEQLLLPHYDPLTQPISDLGNTVMYPGYCEIFNVSVFLIGVLSVLGALLLTDVAPRVGAWRFGLFSLFVAGLGAMGVGLSPENVNGLAHGGSAFLAFFFGGLALLALGRSAGTLLRMSGVRPTMLLGGLVDLGALIAFVASVGGKAYYGFVERIIVIPVLSWAILFGGLLVLGKAVLEAPATPGTSPAQA